MVFDVVVGSAFEHLGDLSPPVAMLLVSLKHQFFLFGGPCLFIDGGVEVVMPSKYVQLLPLTTLFPTSRVDSIFGRHPLTDLSPILDAVSLDESHDALVLLK